MGGLGAEVGWREGLALMGGLRSGVELEGVASRDNREKFLRGRLLVG